MPFGSSQIFNLSYWVMMAGIIFWQFILVYSSMVLPPSWVLEVAPGLAQPAGPAWKDALRPMVWLIPFTAYLVVFLLIASLAAGPT